LEIKTPRALNSDEYQGSSYVRKSNNGHKSLASQGLKIAEDRDISCDNCNETDMNIWYEITDKEDKTHMDLCEKCLDLLVNGI